VNIRERLTNEHSKRLTMAIVDYIGDDTARFKTLMDIFLNSEYRLTQRAAWPLSYVCIAQPKLVRPYYAKLVAKLKDKKNHPAIARNILRIFQEIDIPEKHQAELLDECFRILRDAAEPVAVKAFAISTAARLCMPYPELKQELLMVLRELSQYPQTPAIGVRIKRAVKELT